MASRYPAPCKHGDKHELDSFCLQGADNLIEQQAYKQYACQSATERYGARAREQRKEWVFLGEWEKGHRTGSREEAAEFISRQLNSCAIPVADHSPT